MSALGRKRTSQCLHLWLFAQRLLAISCRTNFVAGFYSATCGQREGLAAGLKCTMDSPSPWSYAACAAYFGDLLCRFCDHYNPAGAKFCNDCGSPLHLKPCEQCG